MLLQWLAYSRWPGRVAVVEQLSPAQSPYHSTDHSYADNQITAYSDKHKHFI